MKFQSLVRPAIMKVLQESDANYRCERDLHHHLTATLATMQPNLFGSKKNVRMEWPTRAQYAWSSVGEKRGNLDYFFFSDPTSDQVCRFEPRMRTGTAMELNFNYDSIAKIKQDVIKLIDPRNCHLESVYFVYALKLGFQKFIDSGLEQALAYLADINEDNLLPSNFHLLLAEGRRNRGSLCYWEASTVKPTAIDELVWEEHRTDFGSQAQKIVIPVKATLRDAPYSVNLGFDKEALAQLLKEFRGSTKRSIDSSLADSLTRELLESAAPKISEGTTNQLARWCKTNGYVYQDGMAIARKISILLFGEVLDREVLGT